MLKRITKNMEMEDVAAEFPEIIGLLTAKGVVCIQCGSPVWGTLGEAAERAGLPVDEFVAELNDFYSESEPPG